MRRKNRFDVCCGNSTKPRSWSTYLNRPLMPEPLAGSDGWQELAFAAIRGELPEVMFDHPRDPIWRSEDPA